MTFTATTSGVAGGPPAYRWSFGDGATADGQTASHVFKTTGTFEVTATVSNEVGGSARAVARVTAQSLTGIWYRPPGDGGPTGQHFDLTQSGSDLDGSFGLCPVRRFPSGLISGRLEDPRSVTWRVDCVNTTQFAGTVAADLESITGHYIRPPLLSPSLTYFRQ